jgi:L-ascorbate metabolism protein UlaG (beta-lactamase superfamily)
MTLTYFGHSTFQIETGDTSILFDPFFGDNPHTHVAPDALSPDVLVLTHAHFDHWADAPHFLGPDGPLLIANFEIIQYAGRHHDHANSQPLNEGGAASFEWGAIEATHARHTSSFPDGTYGGVPQGFLLEIEDTICYNTGDTAPFAEMEWIGDMYDVELAMMPIGDVFTMGIDGAVMAAEMINPARVMPLHYDTFGPIEVDMSEFRAAMSDAGFETMVMDFDASVEL